MALTSTKEQEEAYENGLAEVLELPVKPKRIAQKRGGHMPEAVGEPPTKPPTKPRTRAVKKVEPKQTDLTINYSVGVKANLGNYQSADIHLSKTEKWNVEGMTNEAIQGFWENRYDILHIELGELIEQEYDELKGNN